MNFESKPTENFAMSMGEKLLATETKWYKVNSRLFSIYYYVCVCASQVFLFLLCHRFHVLCI